MPFFIFADEPFWGQDRLALLERALAKPADSRRSADVALDPTRNRQQAVVVVASRDELGADRQAVGAGEQRQRDGRHMQHRP